MDGDALHSLYRPIHATKHISSGRANKHCGYDCPKAQIFLIARHQKCKHTPPNPLVLSSLQNLDMTYALAMTIL